MIRTPPTILIVSPSGCFWQPGGVSFIPKPMPHSLCLFAIVSFVLYDVMIVNFQYYKSNVFVIWWQPPPLWANSQEHTTSIRNLWVNEYKSIKDFEPNIKSNNGSKCFWLMLLILLVQIITFGCFQIFLMDFLYFFPADFFELKMLSFGQYLA